MSGLRSGSIVLDAPEQVPSIWGERDQVLWSEGEPLILAGPPGVGKTTLAQQVALARSCVADGDLNVLGYLVRPDNQRRTLYVAADRPRQALRSMRRMVEPRHRERLDDGLLIWEGAFDALDAEWMLMLADAENVGTIVLDSIKDVAGDPSEGKVGEAFNRSLQALVSNGIEVMALHHPRKATDGNRKPRKLDDLYGSTWLGAGAGSVVYLWGEAGDPVVELRHLKQPCSEVGPLTIVHDHIRGISRATGGNVRELIDNAANGLTVGEVAEATFATANPSRSEIEKARRRLDSLVAEAFAEKLDGDGEKAPSVYVRVIDRDSERDRSRSDHGEAENGLDKRHAPITHLHAGGSPSPDSPLRGGGRDRDRDSGVELMREAFNATCADDIDGEPTKWTVGR